MYSTSRAILLIVCLVYSAPASAFPWNPVDWFRKPASPPATPQKILSDESMMPKMPVTRVQPSTFSAPKLPQLHMPEIPRPSFELPKFGAEPAEPGQSPAIIEKWNQGLEKTKQALTLPKLSPPSFTPPKFADGTPIDFNPFNNKPGEGKSLLPKWPSKQPEPAQPPTVQDWLGQPRPQ